MACGETLEQPSPAGPSPLYPRAFSRSWPACTNAPADSRFRW